MKNNKSINLSGLRETHFQQLYGYIVTAERDGYYYGNEKQFRKRHNEIKEWITNIIYKIQNKEI